MPDQNVRFIDSSRKANATARVSERDGRFVGEIDLEKMPDELLATFEEYERLVNGQMFSLLDHVEEQIDSRQIEVLLESGQEIAIEDLQVYPRSGRVSFRPKAPAIPPSDLGPGEGVGYSGARSISD
jgi:hypothetical protein